MGKVVELLNALGIDNLTNTVLAIIIPSVIFYLIIYPLYFHPLSKIPGPQICALTKYFILYKSWHEERNRYVQSLHEKYGSIVRIGPNEIDINDASYLRDIYVADFDKSSFYSNFINYNQENTFSIIGKKTHSLSRKVSHKFYSKTTVCSESIMPKIEQVMTNTLKAFHKFHDKPIDSFILFCDMAMDTVTSFSFGIDNYFPLLEDPFGKGEKMVRDFGLQSSTWFWVTQMPSFYDWVVTKKVIDASQRCYDWIEEQFDYSFKRLSKTSDDTLLKIYFDSDDDVKINQKNPIFSEVRTKSEIFDHIAAGHLTTGVTLCYLFYELAKHPEIQQLLRDELLEKLCNGKPIPSNDTTPFKYSLVDNEEFLPYLHAVINETFRVHAAIPGQEPRVVPDKGLIWRGDSKVAQCKIPGGTTVVIQPWSLHRIPSIFPNPDKFDPQRWIDSDENQLKVMKANLMHFGSGGRMCIGMNLAVAEIKIIIPSLLCRYKIELDETFNYDYDAEMLDMYTTVPRKETMMLRFVDL